VSQPAPFSRGETRVVPRTRLGVQGDGKKLALVRKAFRCNNSSTA
jgi:flagellar P-ring protein precursor FlgI